ncbi:MAG: cytochrome c maturation protein CcmE [Gammaproteobacteria bacterium]|nr:cytochrome c maturation protein CcmE [Gammaproteobacteria bacterium]
MTPARRRRLIMVMVIVAGVAIATTLGLRAFQRNLLYYFTPSQVAAGDAHPGQRFRMGGLVALGSVQRAPGSMTVRFTLTDMQHSVPVVYTGILPDLFREGQGIVVHGRLDKGGLFTADQVLAKHDSKYMPPEVAAAIQKAMQAQQDAVKAKGAS